jgi:predicted transcriptional regulator
MNAGFQYLNRLDKKQSLLNVKEMRRFRFTPNNEKLRTTTIRSGRKLDSQQRRNSIP